MEKFYKLLNLVFTFEKIGRFPLVLFALIYFLPALLGLALLSDQYAWSFLEMLLTVCLVYVVSYYWLLDKTIKHVVPARKQGSSLQDAKTSHPCVLDPGIHARKTVRNINYLILLIFGGYLIFYFYTVLTAPHLAIVESFKGADGHKIALAREEFLKARHGGERILGYINTFFTSALMPYLIATLYIVKHKFRHLIVGIFILTLMVSLEKVLVLKALLPLLVLAANDTFLKRSYSIVIMLLMLGVILLTSCLANIRPIESGVFAKARVISETKPSSSNEQVQIAKQVSEAKQVIPEVKQEVSEAKQVVSEVKQEISEAKQAISEVKQPPSNTEPVTNIASIHKITEEKKQDYGKIAVQKLWALQNYTLSFRAAMRENPRFLFGANTFSYMVNRAIWIPYVTAYDWLRYFDIKKHNQYFLGSTSGLMSFILGEKRVYAEREVFGFQYGQASGGTGVANSAFFIDAYVNFGWIGIVIYSFLLAVVTKIFANTEDIAAKSVYYYFMYMFSIGAMPAILVSNGLMVLIFIAIFRSKHKDYEMQGVLTAGKT